MTARSSADNTRYLRLLAEKYPVPVLRHGVPDEFGRSGTAAQVLEYFGLTPEGIADKVRKAVSLKR